MHYKDAILNELAEDANVAQFVSFSPALKQRFARVHGYEVNFEFSSLSESIDALLAGSGEGAANVRSFDPDRPKSREFIYGLSDANEIEENVRRLAGEGLHTIVNETIDVCDGGVSGVALGGVLEFAPCDTPRAVEKSGTAALPRTLGLQLLEKIYGFTPQLDYGKDARVEFSIHPLKRGFRKEHTIVWEKEEVEHTEGHVDIRWPNKFSRFIGDKAYGLLIADLLGLPVPRATVIARNVAPFRFGQPTGNAEKWIRTCPTEQMPGKYSTQRGWTDPFRLMHEEDPEVEDQDRHAIASLLSQDGVDAKYSGGLVATEAGELTIEGIRGFGDRFMSGKADRVDLPARVTDSVRELYGKAEEHLGPVRMEWAADSDKVWIVQFHKGSTVSSGRTVYPGSASSYREFEVAQGLEALRELIAEVEGGDEGVTLIGDVGVTSHFGDLLRKAQIPSRIELRKTEGMTTSR